MDEQAFRAEIRRLAAEAHRRKWAFDPHNPEAFDALHILGSELVAALNALERAEREKAST